MSFQDYTEPNVSDQDLDAKLGLVPEGEFVLRLRNIADGSTASKTSGYEYAYWILEFEVASDGPARGAQVNFFFSFDNPANLKPFIIQKRRMLLRALGVNVSPGQRLQLEQRQLLGRYIRATISHWTPKGGEKQAQIKHAEPAGAPARAYAPEPIPASRASQQQQPHGNPPVGGWPAGLVGGDAQPATPGFDEIPF